MATPTSKHGPPVSQPPHWVWEVLHSAVGDGEGEPAATACALNIPDTVLINPSGVPYAWLGTSHRGLVVRKRLTNQSSTVTSLTVSAPGSRAMATDRVTVTTGCLQPLILPVACSSSTRIYMIITMYMQIQSSPVSLCLCTSAVLSSDRNRLQCHGRLLEFM